jgi:hypothetical protein
MVVGTLWMIFGTWSSLGGSKTDCRSAEERCERAPNLVALGTIHMRSSRTSGWPVLSAANVMSLIQFAKLNGHDPFAYLKDLLERLRTQPASRHGQLLPHRGSTDIHDNANF